MRYGREYTPYGAGYRRRLAPGPGGRRYGRPPAPPPRRAARRRPPPRTRPPRPRPPGAWYTGPGESHRYGSAPVPYGPEHTYDYHMGDRYGYGPDFYDGEARVRRMPRLRRRPPPHR